VLLDDLASPACDPTLPLRYRVLLILLDTAEATASPKLIIGADEVSDGRTVSERPSNIKPNPLSREAMIGVVLPLLAFFERVAGEYGVTVLLRATSDRMFGEDVLLDNPCRLLEPGVPKAVGTNDEDEGDRR
jgi:hypothetical protein